MNGEFEKVKIGPYMSYWFDKTPRRMLYYMSYYRFASKVIGCNRKVIDFGCNEGLGTWLLAVECGYAKGIDIDKNAIDIARQNWQKDNRIDFVCDEICNNKQGKYDAVVSFDVIEHINPENEKNYFQAVYKNLMHDGVAIIGTPSFEGQIYASEASKTGHVNIYSFSSLEKTMSRYFNHVFMFCANDEIIHTGFDKMAHYLIAVGCQKRKASRINGSSNN